MKGKYPVEEWGNYIPTGGVNDSIAAWHAEQPDRVQTCASPSTLMECPRVVWLRRHGVPATNVMGWGKKQRLMLGRITENMIAEQLRQDGRLLWHWKDDHAGESVKFAHGEGMDMLAGTPDLLMWIAETVAVSDSKTARSDSYQWLPIEPDELWKDSYWFKHRLQLTAYFMLCHWNKDWFTHRRLPLPELCDVFSYALDDGIVRREVYWKPPKADMQRVITYTRRWNQAYHAETMPECTCQADGTVKFCRYGIMPEGKKVCVECCASNLIKETV